MSSSSAISNSGYEFNDSQNQVVGNLARRMSLVGMVMVLFGLLQMVNGMASLIMSRKPDRIIEAAEKAGVGAEQLNQLREALAGGFWSSPIVISAIAFALAGLLLLLVGLWTTQAASGFAGIVRTRGNDIPRLMDALGALNLKYGMMYYMIMVAAIVSLISLLISLWQTWGGGALTRAADFNSRNSSGMKTGKIVVFLQSSQLISLTPERFSV